MEEQRERPRVLWVLNLMPPIVGERLKQECSIKEGWITGLLEQLIKEKEVCSLELGICYPVRRKEEEIFVPLIIGQIQIACYGFYEDTAHPECYEEEELKLRFTEIINVFRPDLLHIFGTEYGHTLAAVKAYGRPNRTLIGLQGVISACGKAYLADLPPKIYKKNSLRDWIRQDGMLQQQKKFLLRGEREKEALKYTANITGRTVFDRKAASRLNPHARYFLMNETLRKEFDQGTWELEKCIPHRIFFSQADYPLKGFHYLLQSMPMVKEVFPDVSIGVAGNSLIREGNWKERIKMSAYGQYLQKLIRETGMEGRVQFLGKLSAKQMKEEYLKSHTFVCSSSLENSPNSVGEAMCLGLPVVAAKTGGIPSMLEEGKEGLLYTKGSPKALGRTLIYLWENDQLQKELSYQGMIRGKATHNGEKNYARLLEIYGAILEREKKDGK